MVETQTGTSKRSETQGTSTNNENVLAGVAYILTWITGLIVLLTSKPEEKYKRWHAIQAIGLGIAVTAFYVLVNIVLFPMMSVSLAAAGLWAMLVMLVNLAMLVLIIVMAVTAFQGKKVRLPVIAGFADKNA